MENNGWTLEPRKRNVLCFFGQSCGNCNGNICGCTFVDIPGILPASGSRRTLWIWRVHGQCHVCVSSMGDWAKVQSQRWQPIHTVMCVRIFFSTLTYCTLLYDHNLWTTNLQILQESIYNWTHQSCDFSFFLNAPHGPMTHIPQGNQPSSWPWAGATGCAATRLEEPHQWEMPSVTETCFGTHLWSIEMSKCTGLQSE